MKKPIGKAIIFLLGFFLISIIIQSLVFYFIKNLEVGELGVVNKIMSGNINSQIIISGASRSYVGINPKIIEEKTGKSCYNISQNGARLATQLAVLKSYLKNNSKPEIIIQELGMYTLTFDEKIYAPYKYLPYLEEEELYEGLKLIDSELWINRYFPFTNLTFYNTNLQKLLIKDYKRQIDNKRDYLVHGFHPNKSSWSIDEEAFYKNPIGIYNITHTKAVDLLKELIDICEREKIKLILVNTPEYYTITPLYKYRQPKLKIINQIVQEKQVTFLDYASNEICKNKKLFYNFRHLNDKGAHEFTQIFTSDLIN